MDVTECKKSLFSISSLPVWPFPRVFSSLYGPTYWSSLSLWEFTRWWWWWDIFSLKKFIHELFHITISAREDNYIHSLFTHRNDFTSIWIPDCVLQWIFYPYSRKFTSKHLNTQLNFQDSKRISCLQNWTLVILLSDIYSTLRIQEME